MKLVRMSVFETNSSSTHSLTIVTAEEFNKFTNGELVMLDEALAPAGTKDKWGDEGLTAEAYWEDGELEGYTHTFTTPSGDNMVAFGKYGYNG
jgi:hypothetical protein